MTLNEIAYSILEPLNRFKMTTEERIPLRFVYKKIHDARATIAKNRLPKVDQDLYQHLECLEMEDYSMNCDDCQSSMIHKIVRIPNTMSELGSKEFYYFGFDDFTPEHKINIVNFSSFLSYRARTYTRMGMRATRIPEGLLIKMPVKCNAKYFTALAVLNNPLDAVGCRQLTPDDPYPIPQNYLMELEIMVKKDLNSSSSQLFPGDYSENKSDNPADAASRPVNSTTP